MDHVARRAELARGTSRLARADARTDLISQPSQAYKYAGNTHIQTTHYCPPGHAVQFVLACDDEYCPAVHAAQLPAGAPLGWCHPAGQPGEGAGELLPHQLVAGAANDDSSTSSWRGSSSACWGARQPPGRIMLWDGR
eukprot:COSAG01_NODE_7196_length_3308_cov_16.219071_4_plen_138_part_00